MLFCRRNKTRDVEYLEQFTGFTSEHNLSHTLASQSLFF